MEAIESKERHNSSSSRISTGVFIILFAVISASIIIFGLTVTHVAAYPADPTNSTVVNQTDAGQISSKHDTSMNAIRNMK